MKIKDILNEVAEPGTTSVESIGKVEFKTFNGSVCLIKRNQDNKPCTVARINRTTGEGWSMVPTKIWKELNLPHFGNLQKIKLPIKGKKTITNNLKDLLKAWGIRHDRLEKYLDQ
jgi:hypothetical protein